MIQNNSSNYRLTNSSIEPIVSVRKNPRHAYIPPFSFIGELDIGISGFWYPTSVMELQRASLSCSGYGTGTASITVLKQEPAVPDPLVIGTFSLAANETKRIISLNETMVTPYDKIYVASWTNSGHTGVVIQIVGTLMS